MGPRGEAPVLSHLLTYKIKKEMNKVIKGKMSLYSNAKDTSSKNYIDFIDILKLIKYSPQWLIEMTEDLKGLYSKDQSEYKKKKTKLPLFCPSGCFSYRNSDPSNLITYSNILVLDFDWNDPDPYEIENFRKKLIQYATPLHIYAIWKSPAKGIKAAMLHSNTDSGFHTELFIQVKNKLYSKTPQLDMTCKDIGRACFLCHDPDLFINKDPNLKEYQFQHDPSYNISNNSENVGINHKSYGQFQHTSQEIMINKGWQLKCSDKKLLNMIVRSCNISNPEYFKDGNRHKEVLRRATLYCKDGVLYENALWSLIGQFGDKSKAELNNADIESMVRSCYHKARSEFGKERENFINRHRNNQKI